MIDEYSSTADHHYLGSSENEGIWLEGLYSFLRYFVLLNTLIPISLVVSLEIIKVIQSYYIMNDANMVTHAPIEHTSANVAQTNIVEELGQIGYLFADKTGTLTQNVMSFKAMCIGERLGVAETPRLCNLGSNQKIRLTA